MKTRSEKDQARRNGANPSRRNRLDTLLFDGAKLGTTLLSLAVFTEPKFPVLAGD
jgi:hypothetical protein